jgi:hypothetical protein
LVIVYNVIFEEYSMRESTEYRRIWTDAIGIIPTDENGRTYEIHHLNGDHSDNRLENLICVSIQEHYEIHSNQSDFQAMAAIAIRMKIPPDEQRILNVEAGKMAYINNKGIHGLTNEQRLINSTKGGHACAGNLWYHNNIVETKSSKHPGLGWSEGRLPSVKCGYAKGKLLGSFWNNGCVNVRSQTSPGIEWQAGRLLNDDQRKRRQEIGMNTVHTNESKQKISDALKGKPKNKVTCPHCGKVGGVGALKRWHFDHRKERLL